MISQNLEAVRMTAGTYQGGGNSKILYLHPPKIGQRFPV